MLGHPTILVSAYYQTALEDISGPSMNVCCDGDTQHECMKRREGMVRDSEGRKQQSEERDTRMLVLF